MSRVTEDKPLPLRVYDAVYTKQFATWELGKEAFSQLMYPVIEKCAMAFPEYAMFMSQKHIDGYHAAICFNNLFEQKYRLRYQQSWMRHKRPSITMQLKVKPDPLFSESLVREYCSVYHEDYQSVIEAIERFPDEMKVELKAFKTDFVDSRNDEYEIDTD